MQTDIEERFWAQVDQQPADQCWPWLGCHQNDGRKATYGQFWDGAKSRPASQVVLELSGKPRPNKRACALHSCDNQGCVNPSHLRWGTHKENMADCIARGRFRKAQIPPRFSEMEAEAIRHDERSERHLAEAYRCARNTIGAVKRRKGIYA